MIDPEDTDIVTAHRKAMGYLLARAHLLLRSRLVTALEGTPLHMGHVVILSSLYTQNDLSQVQLTRISGIEKSSVVLFLDALEKDGWVERWPHPTDRRAHRVHLTESGRERFTEVGRALYYAETQVLSVFESTERTQLETLLNRLIDSLES